MMIRNLIVLLCFVFLVLLLWVPLTYRLDSLLPHLMLDCLPVLLYQLKSLMLSELPFVLFASLLGYRLSYHLHPVLKLSVLRSMLLRRIPILAPILQKLMILMLVVIFVLCPHCPLELTLWIICRECLQHHASLRAELPTIGGCAGLSVVIERCFERVILLAVLACRCPKILLLYQNVHGPVIPTMVAPIIYAGIVRLRSGFKSGRRELATRGDGRRFLRLIREYNSMFAFTSLGVHIDDSVNTGGGPYVFKICGVVCHQIGSLLPPSDNPVPRFAQLYIFDTLHELDHRLGIFASDDVDAPDPSLSDDRFSSMPGSRRRRRQSGNGGTNQEGTGRRVRPRREEPDCNVVDSLRSMLNEHNPLVQTFRMAERRLFSPESPNVAIRLYGHEGTEHGNRYSLPAAPELAALIVDDFSTENNRFDVIVQKDAGLFQRVSPLNPSLMDLQYPLLFPYGSMGFHLGIKYQPTDGAVPAGRQDVSMLEYYCYRFHYRKGEPNPFTCCGRLSNQIIVDSFSCVESSRLSYHFWNQDALRFETYQGLSDALGEGTPIGKNVGVEYCRGANPG